MLCSVCYALLRVLCQLMFCAMLSVLVSAQCVILCSCYAQRSDVCSVQCTVLCPAKCVMTAPCVMLCSASYGPLSEY
jgi:hypothetical protein